MPHLDQGRRNAGVATGREDGVIKRPVGVAGEHDDAFWGDLLQGDVRLHGVVVTDWEHGNGSLLTSVSGPGRPSAWRATGSAASAMAA